MAPSPVFLLVSTGFVGSQSILPSYPPFFYSILGVRKNKWILFIRQIMVTTFFLLLVNLSVLLLDIGGDSYPDTPW